MVARFSCPYLSGEVELRDERERHIAENHPDLLPEHRDRTRRLLQTRIRYVLARVLRMLGFLAAGLPVCAAASIL